MEMWKPIKGYEGLYEVSDMGKVKRLQGWWCRHDRLKSTFTSNSGYARVSLARDGVPNGKKFSIHRLVAEAFVGVCPPGQTVNHKNGDKLDNSAANLEYTTQSQNQIHAYRSGLQQHQCGSARPMSKLREKDVIEIRKSYENGMLQIDLAKRFGVTDGLISGIVTRKRWKHL